MRVLSLGQDGTAPRPPPRHKAEQQVPRDSLSRAGAAVLAGTASAAPPLADLHALREVAGPPVVEVAHDAAILSDQGGRGADQRLQRSLRAVGGQSCGGRVVGISFGCQKLRYPLDGQQNARGRCGAWRCRRARTAAWRASGEKCRVSVGLADGAGEVSGNWGRG